MAMLTPLPKMLMMYLCLGEASSCFEISPMNDETSVAANTMKHAASTPKMKYPSEDSLSGRIREIPAAARRPLTPGESRFASSSGFHWYFRLQETETLRFSFESPRDR